MSTWAEPRVFVEVLVILMLTSTAGIAAQESPRLSVLAGLGNTFGWIGGQVEGYAVRGRISGFVGVGYMPNLLNDEGSGVAGAVGVRAFTSGSRHRGLLEVSLTALSNDVSSTLGSDVVEKRVGYGPGVAVGYQFIGDGGITVLLSGGVGLDDEGLDPEGSRLQPTLGVGLGITVR
jgi:hypothetical protein